MDATLVALAMLLAVVVSGWLARCLPALFPLPLIQIGLGAIIGVTATYRVSLAPDVFFLLFLPPLLFNDAWRIPRDALFREGWPVIQLALGLVCFTVLGLGLAIHWMIPSMPTPVAFALAAVLSPTDAVTVLAIASRYEFPPRLLTILQGEALLNDASGLVCLRLAIAAIITGSFHLVHAMEAFARLAVGGAVLGAATTLVIARLKQAVAARVGEDPTNETFISFLVPFAAYLMAEVFDVSGVLAAVTAGLTMGYIESKGHALALTRVRRGVVWDAVQVAMNGMIFVLLGEQLPGVVAGARLTTAETGHSSRWWLVGYVVAIGVALHAVRLIWVWVSLLLGNLYRRSADQRTLSLDWRISIVATVGGVRGTATLAGILTLPIAMLDGTPLPARDLAICLAAGVIIFSLLVADVVLQLALGRVDMAPKRATLRETRARAAAAAAGLRAIEHTRKQLQSRNPHDQDVVDAAARVAARYRERLGELSKAKSHGSAVEHISEIERRLQLAALKAERKAVLHQGTIHAIDQATERKLMHEIDLTEAVQHER